VKEEKKWYALYTKPRWEKKVDILLTKKGIESWCPIQKIERQWSDRKKVIEDPLFKSYVFVHINDSSKKEVLITDGVLNFVHFEKKPAIISNDEIAIIKRYLADETAKISIISNEGFEVNAKVKVNWGVFMDNVGTVIRGNKNKVFVQLQTLGQIMIVEFKTSHLIPEK